ncbi:MAG TPA: DMT family transporter [Rhabdochlamydiaceae bacterium]
MEKFLKIKSFFLLFLCALCWGPSYLFIKIAVPTIPPLTLVFLRTAIATLVLYGLCCLQKTQIFNWRKNGKHYAILGITLNAVPFYLISYGELYITSSLAGILNSLTLIFTATLAHFFAKEPFTKNKIIGILSGIIGLCIIYLPLVFQQRKDSELGALMIILACLSYGIGTVYARTHLHNVPSIITLTAQLSIATAIVLPFALLIEHPYRLAFPPMPALLGAIGLGVLGTAAGFLFFYKALQIAGATYASLSVLLVPIFAMILGSVILQEHLTGNVYLGAFFILAGVLSVNPLLNKK